MRLVDTHCHLDVEAFDEDRDEVVLRARAAGVTRQVLPGITAQDWPRLRDVCRKHEGLFPAYGLHPTFLDAHRPGDLKELEEWITRESPVAVGECGLDYFVDGLDRDEQTQYFQAQLELAGKHDLPLIIHARRAVDPVIHAIRGVGGLRGVVHSFSGSRQQAEQLWEQGFMLGLGGPVTYERAKRLRRLASDMPLEWLLLETDAPDQPNAGQQGERNEPARVVSVLQAIAELRNMAPADLAAATTANAERLFGLSVEG